ncbi:MAG: hypothetical protein A3G32_10370 [Deltaproteobacteria bacterium RIFCSPLOWO2_12_FULL_40_28]|nr:MAG: hypothetical protein A3C45_05380 [Deltaproteobacteria bacterium RIFCSPHIGHO2_02_FULL_40_28]OGQ20428.1 MAG: hypothetical protein A3E27_00760 [Deltaproteobacteria bacterium RIFCSPHIGHO2_12_FULL_40_32]OGQ41397.1 MAG: hypothetical protein A3I69_02410 [Deltaproteobacteria bacterium RIFCSPLOWO2_02_FULL_40_36]OGQ55036.1 MAG: hypothetical protein A3G32_10370 [Deltaproteobacteria bacterium RIFCSPLOWO2_12_FULL_40_28]
MHWKNNSQVKVGLFVLGVLVILIYITLRIGGSGFSAGGHYTVYVAVNSAVGLTKKAPVQIAGVPVGFVSDIELIENQKARLKLKIKRGVLVSSDAQVQIKAQGFLGDTYIEIYQPGPITTQLETGQTLNNVATYGDISQVAGQVGAIAEDIKAVTATLKTLMAGDDSSFAKSLKNIEAITSSLGRVSVQNEGNLNTIVANLKALSENLNLIVARNTSNVDQTLGDLADAASKIRNGEGTIGRLINDDETVEKLNESLDQLNNVLGTTSKMQIDLGYKTEYLGTTEAFKHYVSLKLKPKPDKYFIFEFVDDPAPDSSFETRQTTITSGGVSTEVTEEIETTQEDKFRFTAQLAKEFYGLTVRGGLIESSGGVGLDYDYGPFGVDLSFFDLETKRGEKPHLKAGGSVNLTKNLFLTGGLDDMLNPDQDTDWYMGAGLEITDEDLKSIFGLMSLKP